MEDDDKIAPEHEKAFEAFLQWIDTLAQMDPADREVILARRLAELDRQEKRLRRETPARVKRARKPALAGALKAAAKVGIELVVAPDGSMRFNPPAKSNGSDDEVNPWDTVLTHVADEKRPS